MDSKRPHTPVLLRELLELFHGQSIFRMVDGTVGAAGHAEQLLAAHPEIVRYFAIDRDPSALLLAKERLLPWHPKLSFLHGNFSEFPILCAAAEEPPSHRLLTDQSALPRPFDAILFDFGVSSMQLDTAERGFSFNAEGPLDMRMDPTEPKTAADLLATSSEEELSKLFWELGEEPAARRCARAIVRARDRKPLTMTQELVALLRPILPPHGRRHPLTKIFQALRIAVNGELEAISTALSQAIEQLAPGGILAAITFHSLEDRIVKRMFRKASGYPEENEDPLNPYSAVKRPEAQVQLLTRKSISPCSEELLANPRARSARLRAVRKLPIAAPPPGKLEEV